MQSLSNIRCIKAACARLSLPAVEHDPNGNLISVNVKGETLWFSNYATPFNQGVIDQICKDKEFTYKVLKDAISMPKTKAYFDPAYQKIQYAPFREFSSEKEIVADIFKNFSLPMIVKMNSGSHGTHVFLCKTKEEVETAIAAIFQKNSSDYDYIALAEDYIESSAEYRVICFDGQVVLAYLKDNSNAVFTGNLSPLHWEGAKAVLISDTTLVATLTRFLAPSFKAFPIHFGGFDVIEDKQGNLHLLEVNSRPDFSIFIRGNGDEPVTLMYEKILVSLAK